MSNDAATAASSSKNHLLPKKKDELGSIARGHKRKLHEYLVVSQSDPTDHPIPHVSVTLSANDQNFLDNADITKGRIFQASSIPPRRQLRSHTAQLAAQNSTTSRVSKAPPKSAYGPRSSHDVRPKASSQRGATNDEQDERQVTTSPGDEGRPQPDNALQEEPSSAPDLVEQIAESWPKRQDLRASQPDTKEDGGSSDILMGGAPNEVPIENGKPSSIPPSEGPEHIGTSKKQVVSIRRDNQEDSNGATPIPADEGENVPVDLIERKNANDAQEGPGKGRGPGGVGVDTDMEEATAQDRQEETPLAISVTIPLPKVISDAISSPGSTAGALSATTPALHEVSTDTSPDNESQVYDTQGKGSVARSPTVMTPGNDEQTESQSVAPVIEKDQGEIVAARPSSADAQLQLDAEQAAAASIAKADTQEKSTPKAVQSIQESDKLEEENVDDEDEVMAVPTSQDDTDLKGLPTPVSALDKSKEIPDSQESQHSNQIVDQYVAQEETSRESRKSPEKQVKPPKEPSPATASSTSRRTSVAPPIGRMTTRVASGTIRNRSIDEIIGEKELQTVDANARKTSASDSHSSKSTSRASTPQTPLMRISIAQKQKEKELSKLSHVIFPKQAPKRQPGEASTVPKLPTAKSDHYLKPYFEKEISDHFHQPSLHALIQSAHKTISTADNFAPILETQRIKILRRMRFLQEKGQWSLRQPKRAIEPPRPTTHRDLLIQEMKWMRTDFREERKWKMAVAKNLARECALHHEFRDQPSEQALLKVKVKHPPRSRDAKEAAVRKDCYPNLKIEVLENDIEMVDVNDNDDHPTPDLIPSGEESSPPEDFDEEIIDIRDTIAPTAIFTLADDDVVFRLTNSPTSEKLLNELPLYGAPLRVPQSVPTTESSSDAHWKRPILPLSKYTEGQMVILDKTPPRKKSRFEYESEDDDEVDVFGERQAQPKLPPENNEVALFNPENKHIRDRIHAGHQFRPPSESAMPMQSFFENREPSQWTKEEEDELKRKVREYSYNWSLISSELQRGSARSCTLYSTGAERRTPWECFERWVSMEGLPQDMAKTTYFRAYTQRLNSAEQNLKQQVQTHANSASSAGASLASLRRPRRSAVAVRVDRRRSQKHLWMIDAMRKNAKKKENLLAKSQQASSLAQQRKQSEQLPARNVNNLHTPQDYSKFKQEREVQLKKRQEQMQAQYLVQRQAQQLQQARQAQNPQLAAQQQQALQQQRNASNGGNIPIGVPNPQNLAVPGQNRNGMQHAGASLAVPLPNPNGLAPPMSVNGIPQAQMQNMPGMRGVGMPPNSPTAAQILQARQISEHQRMVAQQQHAQNAGSNSQGGTSSMPPQGSPPNMRGGNMGMNMGGMNLNINQMRPPSFMGAFNSPGGISSPAPSLGLPPPGLQPGSPRMGRPVSLSGHNQLLQALAADIRAKNPNASEAQLHQLMQNTLHARSQNAMHAASGGAGSPIAGMNVNAGSPIPTSMPNPMSNTNGTASGGDGNGGTGGGNGNPIGNLRQPQMYASMIRMHQQQQQQQQAQIVAQQQQQQQQGQNGGGGQQHGRNGSSGGGPGQGQAQQNQQQQANGNGGGNGQQQGGNGGNGNGNGNGNNGMK